MSIFETKAYDLKGFMRMKSSCDNCQTDFQREPGFYFGAAYVSYGLTVALWVAVYVAMYCFNKWGLIEYEFLKHSTKFFVTGIVVLVLLLPVLFRLSRSLWLSWFVK